MVGLADPTVEEQTPGEEIEPKVEPGSEESTLSEVEVEQQAKGHMSRDAWIEAGNEPDEWVSADRYKEKGEMISQINRLKGENANFEKRLVRNEKLAGEMVKAAVADLEAKRDAAIVDADVEASNKIQQQIDEVKEGAREEPDSGGDPVIQAWNQENKWIQNDSAKSRFAGLLYQQGVAEGLTSQEVVDMVDREVEKEYPGTITGIPKVKQVNARRSEPSTTQKSATTKASKTGLTMNDLTGDELKIRAASSIFSAMSDESFLQSVKNSREDT